MKPLTTLRLANKKTKNSTAPKKNSTAPKTKNNTSASQHSLTQGWLITFVGLTLLVVGIALFIPEQTPEQRFYFRIIIALSTSGLAAIIPGFFDIEIRWLRSTVRAGGAIGIFLLVYQFNPPALAEAGTNSKLLDIAGEYEYTCTTVGDNFSHGGNQHGGKARIQATPTDYGVYISACGNREWVTVYDDNGMHKGPVNPPSSWHTYRGYPVAEDEFQYEYTTRDKEGEATGVTRLKVIRENGQVVRLEGYFKRNTSDGKINGTVGMVRLSN